MSARKIRMTSVGLVAMPADRDESTMTGDDLASDSDLDTAWGELDARVLADRTWPRDLMKAWHGAMVAAYSNDLEGLRRGLQDARRAAKKAHRDTEHEDAALAMLPPVAGRRAA